MTDLRAREPLYAAFENGITQFYARDVWLSAVADRKMPNQPVILFIHGYHNSQRGALGVAANIQRTVNDGGYVVPVTWPSYARYTSYYWDETNAEWASTSLADAATSVTKRFPHIVILAHSMGNRIALAMMSGLRRHAMTDRVDHLIMASPDVDRSTLREVLAAGVGSPVTIYGSRRDQALSASWRAHSYPRGGDLSWWVSGRDRDYSLAWLPDVEVIDTTEVDHTLTGHSAYIETEDGAEDMCALLHHAGMRERGLVPLSKTIPRAPANYFRLIGPPAVQACAPGSSTAAGQISR